MMENKLSSFSKVIPKTQNQSKVDKCNYTIIPC